MSSDIVLLYGRIQGYSHSGESRGGSLIFTGFEFAVGIVVNVWFGWDVWNYSRQIGNVMGQICPKYTLAWFIICLTLLSVWEIIGMAVKGGPPLDQNRKVL